MKENQKTILLTGAAGFIGFHVAEALLARKERVVGLDAITPYNDPKLKQKRLELLRAKKNFTFVEGSITDLTLLRRIIEKERPRVIVHLAAQPGVRYSLEAPQSYVEANVLGSTTVFEAARQTGTPVVYASSSSVYGQRGGVFKETDRTDSPHSIYAATKKATEVIAEAYHKLYGLPLIGLRYFTVYGPWIRTDLALFKFSYLLLSHNTIPLFASGKTMRSFTHISYVVDGTLAAIERIKSGHTIYNLGDEKNVPTRKVLDLLARAYNVKPKILLMPPSPGEVLITKASSKKAGKALKVKQRVSLEKGIAEFAEWFLKNKRFLMSLEDMHI